MFAPARNPWMLAAVLLLSLTGLANCDRNGDQEPLPGVAGMQDYLAELIDRHDLPGLAFAVADLENVRDAGAAGLTRIDGPGQLSAYNRFHIGSISKSLTSTVFAVLVDRGEFDWDDRLADVAPELLEHASIEAVDITIRQLLSHTAGIPAFEAGEDFHAVPATAGTAREQRIAFARQVLAMPLVAPPGSAHVYSNAGYTIAAAIVELRLEKDFGSVTQGLVFEPLGLGSGGVGPPSMMDPREPWGHVRFDDVWRYSATGSEERIHRLILPAGDFHMSVRDLALLGSAHLRALNGEPSILSRYSAKVIHTAVLDDYGLGWNIRETADTHLGGLEGLHTALLVILKNENLAFAVAANAETEDLQAFSELIAYWREQRP